MANAGNATGSPGKFDSKVKQDSSKGLKGSLGQGTFKPMAGGQMKKSC